MFVHYRGTKAGFINKEYPEIYKNDIVFIDNNGTGECIYTHGNYFANFKELISQLNFVKGVVINNVTYNTVTGGGYLEFSGKDPSTVEVNVGTGGIEIGLSDEFKNNIINIEKTLKTISNDYLTEEDRQALIGSATEEYNTLGKIESKIKALKESIKVSNITQGSGIEISDSKDGVINISVSIDNDSIKLNNEGKLSINSIDGGTY